MQVFDSKAYEVGNAFKNTMKTGSYILSIINPLNLLKKSTVDISVKIIMKKIYLATIGIVGEEAYKIFSKSYQNNREEIDSNVLEEILSDEDIENTLDTQKDELKMKKRILVARDNSYDFESSFDNKKPLKKKVKIS